jgi:hypothetical protein
MPPVRFTLLRLIPFVSVLSMSALGCNEAPLISAPDAGQPCAAPILEYACHPQDAGLPGCSPDLDSGGLPLQQEEVLDGGSFPVSCTVIVNSPVADIDQQCTQLGTCTCGGDDAGHYNWTCRN